MIPYMHPTLTLLKTLSLGTSLTKLLYYTEPILHCKMDAMLHTGPLFTIICMHEIN